MILTITPNTDVLFRRATSVTTRFPNVLASVLTVGKKIRVRLHSGKCRRATIESVAKVRGGVDVTFKVGKSVARRDAL
jgi:hypothetical protein